MSTLALTYPEAQRIVRDAVKDKSYRLYPIGIEAAAYLRAKRGRLAPDSYRDYESCLDKLAREFPDLELADLAPPVGSQRLAEFMDARWGNAAPRTFNKNLTILREFFKWCVLNGRLYGDPTLPIERHKKRDVHREIFTPDQRNAILASQDSLRDKVALRLLLDYALRKGALRAVQFKHFDHNRRRLTIFTKGGKVREIPIPQQAFWFDLERYIIEWAADPDHYLLCREKAIFRGYDPETGEPTSSTHQFREQPMGGHGAHNWWYRCLARAGIVPEGVTRGERMHKARHTAGQRVVDKTGNLKAAQKLLGHSSIQTTGDIYADWDIGQLEGTLAEVVDDD